MKKNLKVLISSLIIALTFASPQAIHGMEDFSKPDEQGVKRPYALKVSSDSDITEESQQEKRRGKEIRENPFERCPDEITSIILERAVIYNYLIYDKTGNLERVCQTWRDIIEQDAIMKESLKKSIESIKHEKIYQRFLKGVLIYRPQEGSDVGRIDLPIAALGNPLEGTFDLSQCGDAGKYLSISTGYRKGRRAENANKLEIWFAPRFLIEKELTTTAGHFQKIFGKWNGSAPVGIFWTWGGWDNLTYYDYLVTENFDELSNNNLYEKWRSRNHSSRHLSRTICSADHPKISCSFCEVRQGRSRTDLAGESPVVEEGASLTT